MLSFLKKGFSKTFEAIKSTARGKDGEVDKDELEEALLEADVDYEIIEEIFEILPSGKYVSKESLEKVLNTFFEYEVSKKNELEKPYVELVLGVNGAGKTTTIAKLAKL
ncbi:MAG: signal recognition particle receptor subunit alpha, partial [Sulfurospirillaceae bacterium]